MHIKRAGGFLADAGRQSSVLIRDQYIEQRGSCIALLLLLTCATGLTSSIFYFLADQLQRPSPWFCTSMNLSWLSDVAGAPGQMSMPPPMSSGAAAMPGGMPPGSTMPSAPALPPAMRPQPPRPLYAQRAAPSLAAIQREQQEHMLRQQAMMQQQRPAGPPLGPHMPRRGPIGPMPGPRFPQRPHMGHMPGELPVLSVCLQQACVSLFGCQLFVCVLSAAAIRSKALAMYVSKCWKSLIAVYCLAEPAALTVSTCAELQRLFEHCQHLTFSMTLQVFPLKWVAVGPMEGGVTTSPLTPISRSGTD
jgi:hypothetical protein